MDNWYWELEGEIDTEEVGFKVIIYFQITFKWKHKISIQNECLRKLMKP